jgi:hypothetical protein
VDHVAVGGDASAVALQPERADAGDAVFSAVMAVTGSPRRMSRQSAQTGDHAGDQLVGAA